MAFPSRYVLKQLAWFTSVYLLACLPVLANAILPTSYLGNWAWVLYAGPFLAGVGSLVLITLINRIVAKEIREGRPYSDVFYPFARWNWLKKAWFILVQVVAPVTLMAFFSTAVVATINVAAIASVVYDLGMIKRAYTPFESEFTLEQAMLFFLDHALKGALLDVMEVFNCSLPHDLSLQPWKNFWFAAAVVVFRTTVSVVMVGAMLALISAAMSRLRKAN